MLNCPYVAINCANCFFFSKTHFKSDSCQTPHSPAPRQLLKNNSLKTVSERQTRPRWHSLPLNTSVGRRVFSVMYPITNALSGILTNPKYGKLLDRFMFHSYWLFTATLSRKRIMVQQLRGGVEEDAGRIILTRLITWDYL